MAVLGIHDVCNMTPFQGNKWSRDSNLVLCVHSSPAITLCIHACDHCGRGWIRCLLHLVSRCHLGEGGRLLMIANMTHQKFWVHCCDCQCIHMWIGSPALVQRFTEPLPGPPELWKFFFVYWYTSSFTLPTTCTTGKDVWKVWQFFCPKWVLLQLTLHVKSHKQEELIQGHCTSHQLMGIEYGSTLTYPTAFSKGWFCQSS